MAETTDNEQNGADVRAGDEIPDAETRVATHDSADEPLRDMLSSNFLEYASYVIKERAIPDVVDGLKPVQRRILHSLHEMDDGRYHKVANVIGHTMQYHPHGDASIGSALVVLANKEYYIDKQGNFGNIHTGDQASAARYIECRLSPLARDVLFNPEITEYEDSYDGRHREPIRLPSKVPSLLMLGADGIAVGMTTRVMPHNFRELLKAQIAILEERSFEVYPDFLTGGIMDVSDYREGLGRIILRAKVEATDNKTLVIREIPATTSTEGLISSIEDSVRRGKMKIASIQDYTTDKVEIEIKLPRGIYAKDALKRLYAYTDCEVSLSSNIVVIRDNTPVQMTVSEILHHNTDKLVFYLRRELEIDLHKQNERFHQKTLVQIFIENRIYKRIEEAESYERVMAEVREGLEPFRDQLRRDVTDEDIERLLQIQIRRISRFDIDKNRKDIDDILKRIKSIKHHLDHLTAYAVAHLQDLLEKYGDLYPRRTRIQELSEVDIRRVALKNLKVGHDRQGHFVGTQVKNSNKNEDYLACTEYDRLVLLRSDGSFKVIPVPEKEYVGTVKYVLKSHKPQVYSMIYRDKKRGTYYAKRFRIDRYIMNREYRTIPKGCIIENLYTNYGLAVRLQFKPNKRLKRDHADVDFDEIPMRSTGARGLKVADHPVQSVVQLRRGSPTPAGEGEPQEEAPATGSAAEGGERERESTSVDGQQQGGAVSGDAEKRSADGSGGTESAGGEQTVTPSSTETAPSRESGDKPASAAENQPPTPRKKTRKPRKTQKPRKTKKAGKSKPSGGASKQTGAGKGRAVVDEWAQRSADAARVPGAGTGKKKESAPETAASSSKKAGRKTTTKSKKAPPKKKTESAKPPTGQAEGSRSGSSPSKPAAASKDDEDASDAPERGNRTASNATPDSDASNASDARKRIDEDTPFFLE